MNPTECHCRLIARVRVGDVEFRNLRCPVCIDAILESKNVLIREIAELKLQLARDKR